MLRREPRNNRAPLGGWQSYAMKDTGVRIAPDLDSQPPVEQRVSSGEK